MTRKPSSPATRWHTGHAVAQLLGESNRAKAAAALGMGTTVTTLYRWLREAEWPHRNIAKAAAYFNVDERWLLTGKGEKYVAPTGADDPHAAQVEVLLMRAEHDVKRLLRGYTKQLARIYAPDTHPASPPSKRREWENIPTDD